MSACELLPKDLDGLGVIEPLRVLPLPTPMAEIAGQVYIVTGSGKYFRNVRLDPPANLGVVRVAPNGRTLDVLWGFSDGGGPTSELPAHFRSHAARQARIGGSDRVIMHCHATNLIALSYVLELNDANVTRALWEGSTECVAVFPDGVAAMPWMIPGTDEIGEMTAAALSRRPLALWPFHGVFAVGQTLDEAFGLVDVAEKSAEILVKVLSMGGPRQSMTTANFRDIAARFDVAPCAEALQLERWRLAAAPPPG